MTNSLLSSSAQKIESFRDLFTWQEGHRLVLMIYQITKRFPQSEQFALTSQLRRAGVSITSNIAEGFSRNSFKEKVQFYSMSLGSLTEIQNQLLIAKDIEYIDIKTFDDVFNQSIRVSKLINGLLKKTKTLIPYS